MINPQLGRLKSFLIGMTLFRDALRAILANPKLLALSFFPLVLTLVLWGVGSSWVQEQLHAAVLVALNERGYAPEHWLTRLLGAVSWLLVALGAALTFSFAATLVSTPFNDVLAEAAEPFTTPILTRRPPLGWKGSVELWLIDLFRSSVGILGGLGALFLSWVPLLNLLAAAVACLTQAYAF